MLSLPKYLTQDELKRFFTAIESPRDKALFGVIYHYGLRVGEALMLTLDDVNFKNHRITIRRLKNGLGGEKPLWRHTAKLLRAYLRERRDVGPYLFTGRKGPLQKRQVQKLFNDYTKAAAIKERSVHALRHSMAVHLLEAAEGLSTSPTTWATRTFRTRASTPRSPIRCASRSSASSSSIRRLSGSRDDTEVQP
jgi:integrase/recombinase XerD